MRTFRHRIVVAGFAGWMAVCGSSSADDDRSFREFPDEEVLPPAELMRKLIGLRIPLPPELAGRFSPPNHPRPVPPSDSLRPPVPGPGIENPPAIPSPNPGGRNGPIRIVPPIPISPNPMPLPAPTPEDPVAPPDRPTLPLPQGAGNGGANGNPNVTPNLPTPPASPQARDVQSPATPERVVPRNENFRHRFNRILLDAAQKSMGEETDGNESSRSALEALVSRVAKSAQRSMGEDGSNWRRGIREAWRDVRGRVSRSDEHFASLRNGGSAAGPTAGETGSNAMIWAVLALSLLGLVFFLWRRKFTEKLIRHTARLAVRARLSLKAIQSRRDLVLAVDQVVQWNLGPETNWWNSRAVRKSLAANYPHLTSQIHDLVASYEVARYAPQSYDIPKTTLRRCSEILRQLVGANPGQSESQPKTSDDDAIG